MNPPGFHNPNSVRLLTFTKDCFALGVALLLKPPAQALLLHRGEAFERFDRRQEMVHVALRWR